MGQKPMRECRKIGCHILTRETYCKKHREEYMEREKRWKNQYHKRKKYQKYYDTHKRDPKTANFYRSSAWQKARALSIASHYGLCQDCLVEGRLRRADMVHHIKPLREYPELALVQSNLRPLCNKCHAKY